MSISHPSLDHSMALILPKHIRCSWLFLLWSCLIPNSFPVLSWTWEASQAPVTVADGEGATSLTLADGSSQNLLLCKAGTHTGFGRWSICSPSSLSGQVEHISDLLLQICFGNVDGCCCLKPARGRGITSFLMNTKQVVQYLWVSAGTLTFHRDSLWKSHLTHLSSVLDNDFRHVFCLGTWKEAMKSPGSGYDLKTQLQMKDTSSISMNRDSDYGCRCKTRSTTESRTWRIEGDLFPCWLSH